MTRGEAKKGTLPYDSFPVYPGAKEIRTFTFKNGAIKEIAYELEILYPAKEVLDFYGKEMQKRGYRPCRKMRAEIIPNYWQTFTDGTKPRRPYVAQHLNRWENRGLHCAVLLIMKYHWYGYGGQPMILEKNKNLGVTLQIININKKPKGVTH